MATINPIQPLWNEMPLTRAEESGSTGKGESFTDIFQNAIKNVEDTDKEAVQLEYLMSTGQLDNPAELGIALYKASTAVSLLVNLRNKAVEAYDSIMRLNL